MKFVMSYADQPKQILSTKTAYIKRLLCHCDYLSIIKYCSCLPYADGNGPTNHRQWRQ